MSDLLLHNGLQIFGNLGAVFVAKSKTMAQASFDKPRHMSKDGIISNYNTINGGLKMKYILSIIAAVTLLISCGEVETKDKIASDLAVSEAELSNLEANNATIQFLWRGMKYDASLNDSLNSIFIDQEYIKSITDPAKAALGYVATFIGNECWWDGEANDDRSNLDCKIITALGLGYQCSEQHLGFLREWFSNDQQVLSELEKSNCPTTPYTATVQDTFDEMTLSIKEDSIIVKYKASGINMRTQESWEWSETAYFKLSNDNIELINKDRSEGEKE